MRFVNDVLRVYWEGDDQVTLDRDVGKHAQGKFLAYRRTLEREWSWALRDPVGLLRCAANYTRYYLHLIDQRIKPKMLKGLVPILFFIVALPAGFIIYLRDIFHSR